MTQLSKLVNFLYSESDAEVVNYAYSLFETYSNMKSPCFAHKKDMMSYFYRYMKQIGLHALTYKIGSSKIYAQEFTSEQFGYSGYNILQVVGSEKSISPLKASLTVGGTYYKGYLFEQLKIELRIQGLAKALYKKLKKLPEGDWK